MGEVVVEDPRELMDAIRRDPPAASTSCEERTYTITNQVVQIGEGANDG